MQTVVSDHGGTDLLRQEVYEETPSPSPPSTCRWICCSFWRQDEEASSRDMPWSHSRRREDASQRANAGLSPAVVSKIQEVGNQRSSLTPSGSHGLTSRVLERTEYPQNLSDGKVEHFVCQTTELIKRPGQTLGVYIREGNGIDRTDGVFISRLHENGEAASSGLLKVGDEIISINSVDVSSMPVDDVVVAMSIPTRLILRTRFPKNRRGPMAQNEAKGPLFRLKSTSSFYHPETTFEDCMEDTKIESQSAMTSIAVRAAAGYTSTGRAGSRAMPSSASEHTPLLVTQHGGRTRAPAGMPHGPDMASSSFSPPPRCYPPGRPPSTAEQQQISRSRTQHYFGSPEPGHRSLTARDLRAFPPHRTETQSAFPPDHFGSGGHKDLGALSDTEASSLTATARVPPPKLFPVTSPQALIRRANSMKMPLSLMDASTSARMAQFAADPALRHGAPGFSGFSGPPLPHHPLRTIGDLTTSAPVRRRGFNPAIDNFFTQDDYGHSSDSDAAMIGRSAYEDLAARQGGMEAWLHRTNLKPALRDPVFSAASKSNSLPKRRGGRVKWRNDVKGGRNSAMGVCDYTTDSDGAISAPELSGSPSLGRLRRFGVGDHRLRTIDDIFTAQEYQTWRQPSEFNSSGMPQYRRAGAHPEAPHYYGRMTSSAENLRSHLAQPSFASPSNFPASSYQNPQRPPLDMRQMRYLSYADGENHRHRSASLPPKRVLLGDLSAHRLSHYPFPQFGPQSGGMPSDTGAIPRIQQQQQDSTTQPAYYATDSETLYSRQRRFPAQHSRTTARYSASVNGVLILFILEGRGLKVTEQKPSESGELYCVVEIDGEHRARTSISTYENRYIWNEAFEVDVYGKRQADFFVYSWHTKYKHKLCHRGSLKLDETYLRRHHEGQLRISDDVGQKFALTLEPRGQLLVRLAYRDIAHSFRRPMAVRRHAYFGVDLATLVERENSGVEVPILLRRLIEEIERRGVDCNGLYALCGSALKKQELKNVLEKNPVNSDISSSAVPDINVLTGVLKDFLRELPEPLVVPSIYQMLCEAVGVCIPDDKEGSVRLVFGVIDCLPRLNKCALMMLMDHLKYVVSHVSHNSMSPSRLCNVFGPLLFCSSNASGLGAGGFDLCDPNVAIKVFAVLMDLWPDRDWSSESSSSDSCTMNVTHRGERSLVEVWLEENKHRESKC